MTFLQFSIVGLCIYFPLEIRYSIIKQSYCPLGYPTQVGVIIREYVATEVTTPAGQNSLYFCT